MASNPVVPMSKKKKSSMDLAVPPELIERRIYLIRGQKVILDSDLADLYEVPTKALNQALKRNLDRFPADFAFQLNQQEWTSLRSQAVTSRSWGGRRYPPYAFTEQGVAMLSSVLQSKRAILVNIEIMRVFVHLRRLLATQEELAGKLAVLERKYDTQFQVVFDVIQKLIQPEFQPKRRIGVKPNND